MYNESSKFYFIKPVGLTHQYKKREGAQWLSGRVLDSGTEGLPVQAASASLRCVLEQDKFILALHWFNPGTPVPT